MVCEGTTFVSGLAVLFASYYNFNLQYQDEAACTLEFIQRSAALTLSPTDGTTSMLPVSCMTLRRFTCESCAFLVEAQLHFPEKPHVLKQPPGGICEQDDIRYTVL